MSGASTAGCVPSRSGQAPAGPAVAGTREGLVKAPGGSVKEPSRPCLTSENGPYEGPMTDVLYVLITLAAFVGLALLVGVAGPPRKALSR